MAKVSPEEEVNSSPPAIPAMGPWVRKSSISDWMDGAALMRAGHWLGCEGKTEAIHHKRKSEPRVNVGFAFAGQTCIFD